MTNLQRDILTIPGKLFTWTGKFGVSEITDLIGARALHHVYKSIPGSLIYEDAADWGFYVQGRLKKILFVYSGPIMSGLRGEDRENLGWKYTSVPEGYSLEILND